MKKKMVYKWQFVSQMILISKHSYTRKQTLHTNTHWCTAGMQWENKQEKVVDLAMGEKWLQIF